MVVARLRGYPSYDVMVNMIKRALLVVEYAATWEDFCLAVYVLCVYAEQAGSSYRDVV